MGQLRFAALFALAATLAACGETEIAEIPAPLEPTRDSMGHYCGMIVVDHIGPKGQVFLAGKAEPVWFSSVRDTLAFTILPEERKDIVAIYVNDAGRLTDWDRPEPGTWTDARNAVYVVGSDARGGMGAPETVPFSDPEAAARYVRERGGQVYAYGEVPQQHVLGPVDSVPVHGDSAGHGSHDGQAPQAAQRSHHAPAPDDDASHD